MAFSKSASLCDIDAVTLTSSQTENVESEAPLYQKLGMMCLIWLLSQQLYIVYRTL